MFVIVIVLSCTRKPHRSGTIPNRMKYTGMNMGLDTPYQLLVVTRQHQHHPSPHLNAIIVKLIYLHDSNHCSIFFRYCSWTNCKMHPWGLQCIWGWNRFGISLLEFFDRGITRRWSLVASARDLRMRVRGRIARGFVHVFLWGSCWGTTPCCLLMTLPWNLYQ